jgi:hypothetical protein
MFIKYPMGKVAINSFLQLKSSRYKSLYILWSYEKFSNYFITNLLWIIYLYKLSSCDFTIYGMKYT